MRRLSSFLTCSVLLLAVGCAVTGEQGRPGPAEITDALSRRLGPVARQGAITAGGTALRRPATLRAVYAERGYQPVWIAGDALSARGVALLEALRGADADGLSPASYRLSEIEKRIAAAGRGGNAANDKHVAGMVDLELLLADAYLGYAIDLTQGRFDPRAVDREWGIRSDRANPQDLFRQVTTAPDMESFLKGLPPSHPLYAGLKGELARYRAIAEAGGWPAVPTKRKKLEKGYRGRDVAALRDRLAAEGYLADADPAGGDRFDSALDEAVRAYQARNGQDVDGVVGRDTYAALNVPAARRAEQIAANMERLRWVPRSLGKRYLVVDIAGFRLVVFEENSPVMAMPVIVGRESRPTPIFSDTMNHVVFNPFWRVPRSIAIKDELPKIRQDPEFFESHDMEVFRYERGGGTTSIDPAAVDWSTVTEDNFGYLLRQKPGAKNALGRVKFMFPNRYSVYLHDTPSQNLFRRSKRTFSSGCVRVARPIDLGEYLMAGNAGWDRERFVATIEEGKTRTINLERRLPIHLVYLTAWAEEGSPAGFRRDIYGRDAALIAALRD